VDDNDTNLITGVHKVIADDPESSARKRYLRLKVSRP
jgi:hypothetical protein